MLLSVGDIDWSKLSAAARSTLDEIARPLAEGVALEAICEELSLELADAAVRLEELAAECRNLTGGYRLPGLTQAEYDGLRESIKMHGQLVPALTDAAGELIDGHHRARICRELGIELLKRSLDVVLSDDERRSLAFVVNMARRQLPTSARRGLVLAELLRNPSASDRAIAHSCGVSHSTVAVHRRELERSRQLAESSTRRGLDGKERRLPARIPLGIERPRPLIVCPQCGHAFDPLVERR